MDLATPTLNLSDSYRSNGFSDLKLTGRPMCAAQEKKNAEIDLMCLHKI